MSTPITLPLFPAAAPAAPARASQRVATIDWMRGLVMVLMIVDHASMAFDGHHLSHDSALYPDAATMALPAGEFFTRWMTHLCAPSFVFLAGTALALSIEPAPATDRSEEKGRGVLRWREGSEVAASSAHGWFCHVPCHRGRVERPSDAAHTRATVGSAGDRRREGRVR
jgi:hypothetical protein